MAWGGLVCSLFVERNLWSEKGIIGVKRAGRRGGDSG